MYSTWENIDIALNLTDFTFFVFSYDEVII